MAIDQFTLWEFRDTGSNNNGGGFFDRDPGTSVDYTMQDAAQFNPTNLSTDGAGTRLTDDDAGGLFTAAMAGSIINITAGTGFTPGRYELVTFVDSNNFDIDRSAGVSATAGTGYVGGGMALPTDAILELFVAGNTAWFKSGTFTLTGSIGLSRDGTTTKHITYEGYNTSRGDQPAGTDRPLIVCGAFTFTLDQYYNVYHLRGTGTGALVLRADDESTFFNCKAENSSGTSSRSAFLTSNPFSGAHFIGCEGVSTNGVAFSTSRTNFWFCYAHDSTTGYTVSSGTRPSLYHCIADTCTTFGISHTGATSAVYQNNTFYNCGIAINFGTSQQARNAIVMNNIFDNNTTGIGMDADIVINPALIDYNNYTNNGTDVAGTLSKGANATALDPEFGNAAGGDFSVGENMKGIGYGGFPGVNISSMDLGAVQREEGAGGGGETSDGHFT